MGRQIDFCNPPGISYGFYVDQVLNARGAMLDPKGIGGICPG